MAKKLEEMTSGEGFYQIILYQCCSGSYFISGNRFDLRLVAKPLFENEEVMNEIISKSLSY